MAASSTEVSLQERLRITKYSRTACIAAIRGEAMPHALGHPLHRLCVIRGIRYHDGFGRELRSVLPVFTRALNARSIMSNVLPEMDSPDTLPYCIWHPETASENTYRELAKNYPQLAYQVGRACAVAGYSELYKELNVLPDVHIAEEARECGNLAIYEAIMSQAVRYNVMNDYKLCLDLERPKPAYLNGDSCVRWMLDIKQEVGEHATSDFKELDGELFPNDILFGDLGYHETMFNITEDMHVDEHTSDDTAKRTSSSRSNLRWLYEPLPQDLSTVQKDILIVMAAYYGDVDRYSRLRRPEPVRNEYACCVRGIYHNTLFALWWASKSKRNNVSIEKAINARFIMNNVLSRAPFSKYHLPYLIWWPQPAQPGTYRRLADIHPEMLPQIVRACVYANYEELFAELLPKVEPDQAMIAEADSQSNQYFRKALSEEIKNRGIEPQYPKRGFEMHFSGHLGRSSDSIVYSLDADSVWTSFDMPYDGIQCDAAEIETALCAPDAWKVETYDDEGYPLRELNYVDWPPGMTAKKE